MQRLPALPLLFIATLLLPLVLTLAGLQSAPLNEYRAPTLPPETGAYFNADKRDFVGFAAHLEAWYADRVPTRAFFTRLYTQMLYSLFRESSQLHIGSEGWLYYRSVIDVQTPALERLSAASHTAFIENLAQLSALLEEQGMVLYTMPVALKHRYYPEYLPASARHARKARFYDTFMDGLVNDGRTRILDARQLLAEAKRSGLKIFHQTDFHWTDPAGALAFRALLADMAKLEDKQELLTSWDYDIVPLTDSSGGQARALPLFSPLTESSVGLQFKGPNTAFVFNSGNGIEWSGVSSPAQQENLQPILIYGDSFIDAGLRAGMHNFFQSFARARVPNDDLVAAFRNRQPGTRYLLIEFIPSSTPAVFRQIQALIQLLEQQRTP